ncbi:prostamide/prostaglandin F synthase-like [Oratosquilla oratoria]|uniref:prostamide/prostaglandin F synthase-like n=1 Tax=Oratosquilla oratoria TaxID=337810 RepID=UPI003F76D570
MFCRLAAKELSAISPQLSQAQVRLIGIAPEELGLEEFVNGQFFTGELHIDADKKSYKALNFKRFNMLNLLPTLFTKKARSAISKGKEAAVGGDMKGDGFQNGGLLVVSADGKDVLMEYHQDSPADHPQNNDILKALGLDIVEKAAEATDDTTLHDMECEDACALPSKK